MRKTRRHKYLQISVFFLIYAIIHVVSTPNQNKTEESSKPQHTAVVNTESENPEGKDAPNHHEPIDENARVQEADKPHESTNQSHVNPENGATKQEQAANKTEHAPEHESLDKSKSTTSSEHQEHIDENKAKQTNESSTNQTANANATDSKHGSHVANKVLGHFGSTVKVKNNGPNNKQNKTLENAGDAVHGNNTSANHTHGHYSANNILTHVLASSGGHGKKNVTGNATLNATAEDVYKDCSPPAIKQFPHPIMSPTTRRHGGLIIHVLVAVYMFLGLAIVCDEYFVASLDRICEELKMSPDVAGATFMAAGSSAPELATVIIGVFLAEDDIGISGVIGSAVFNIMFVISCCGLCSSVVIYLNWWPLIRDCFFYAVSILVLLFTIYDESVTWVESLILLLTYVIYCVFLHYNTLFESIAYSLPVPFRHTAPTEESGLVSYKTLDDAGKMPNYGMDWSPEKQQENGEQDLKNLGSDWSPERSQPGFANQLSGPALNQATIEASPQQAPPPSKPIQQEYYKPKEYDPSTQVNPLVKPEGGLYAKTVWVIVYPIHWLCRRTMPDCRSEKYKSWYPFTFFVSMVWISFYSYFMVWMITLIGYTLYIPDTVMGLTFVAAGVSVPDALSSIAVIKEGYGDMAVSNAVGSNVFDILVCLGLPWFLKTAIVNPGSTVIVKSKGLTYSTLSLLSTVVLLVVATHMNGWKLDRRYGIILMIWYLIFITLASIYEFNVFEPCPTTDW